MQKSSKNETCHSREEKELWRYAKKWKVFLILDDLKAVSFDWLASASIQILFNFMISKEGYKLGFCKKVIFFQTKGHL